MSRAVMQQALEALEWAWGGEPLTGKEMVAIAALRAALAEPEQPHDLLCVCGAEWDIYPDGREELVAAPTPRKPLTDKEIDELSRTMVKGDRSVNWLCRAIERAHGIGGGE